MITDWIYDATGGRWSRWQIESQARLTIYRRKFGTSQLNQLNGNGMRGLERSGSFNDFLRA